MVDVVGKREAGAGTASDETRRGPAPRPSARRGSTMPLVRFLEKYVVIIALVLVVAVFSVTKTAVFPTGGNIKSILTTQAVLLVVALTLTVVLAAGDLDLSIGGMIGFTAVFVAELTSVRGMSWPAALLLSLVAAVAVGMANGALIVGVRVNPLIVTLAMGTLLDGLSSAVSNSSTIGPLPATLTNFFGSRFLGIGVPFWFAVVLLAAFWYVMHHLPVGRALYFTGEGRESARLIGVRVTRVRVIAFLVSAVGAWLAGVILVGQTGAAQAGVGDPYLLPAYASAFLGAATIRPGRFNPLGTIVGALLLAVGTDGLQLFGIATWVTQVFDGAILIVAVTAAALLGRIRVRS